MTTPLSPNLELLHRLETICSDSAPIISLYLNFPPNPIAGNGVGARLRDQLGQLKAGLQPESLDHAAAMSVRSGVERILELGPTLETMRGQGWGVFVCESLDLEEQILVAPRVWDCASIGPRPYLRPLRAALNGWRRIATAVFDARQAEVTVSYMGEILHERTLRTEVVRKSNRAGWHGLDEHRNRQHAEEVRKRLWRNIADALIEIRREFEIEVIFVGGQDTSVKELVEFLPAEIRSLVGGTFGFDRSMTDAQLIPHVHAMEDACQRRQETAFVEAIYESAAADAWACVGIEDVNEAARRRAIAELAIEHGAMVEGVACSGCGRLDRSGQVCPECGSTTEAVPDILEVIANAVASAGGEIRHVSAETALVEDLVAARLRFPIQQHKSG